VEPDDPMVDLPDPGERNWAVAGHLGALVGLLFALGHLLVPLVIWLLKRDSSDYVAEHARESLNFQLSMTLYAIVAGLLVFVLIGYLLLGLLAIADFLLVIVAATHASRGDLYRYPITLRLIS
jgi:uncharacterized Tic20 family protein